MAEQQETTQSPASVPAPRLAHPLIDRQLIDTELIDTQLPDTPPSPSHSAVDFLKELDTHYTNHAAIRRRYPSPPDQKLHKLPRSEKSSTAIFQIGPDDSGSLSPSSVPKPKTSQTNQPNPEAVEDIDNCSIGTTASWIIDNLDFRTPSSSEVDEEEKWEQDKLFVRGEPEFIFPFPEGSGELPKYLKREQKMEEPESGEEKDERDEEAEETIGEEDGFTAIPEDVDQVALAALVTAFMFGGMWALENGYAKALMFQ